MGERDQAGESVAKYHDERAGYGGVGWEFHAMAATVCRERDALRARLAAADRLLAEVVGPDAMNLNNPGLVDRIESHLRGEPGR